MFPKRGGNAETEIPRKANTLSFREKVPPRALKLLKLNRTFRMNLSLEEQGSD